MKKTTILALTLLLSVTAALKADNLLYDRGLPTINLNNVAGANRSNVAWAYTSYQGVLYAAGDDFNFHQPGAFTVTDLRVWIVGTGELPLSAMWSDLTLYGGGTTPGSISALSTVNTGVPDPDVVITQATYGSGATYQGTSGTMRNMFQVDFLLNWAVDGTTDHTFFIAGTPAAGNTSGVSPFVHASNAGLSGSTQEGADNLFRSIGFSANPFIVDAETSLHNGWDKSSDINVQVFGTPEPSTILLLGTGILAVGLAARRRLQKT